MCNEYLSDVRFSFYSVLMFIFSFFFKDYVTKTTTSLHFGGYFMSLVNLHNYLPPLIDSLFNRLK